MVETFFYVYYLEIWNTGFVINVKQMFFLFIIKLILLLLRCEYCMDIKPTNAFLLFKWLSFSLSKILFYKNIAAETDGLFFLQSQKIVVFKQILILEKKGNVVVNNFNLYIEIGRCLEQWNLS